MPIFTEEIIEQIFSETKQTLAVANIDKVELKQEILMFDTAMKHVKNNPWTELRLLSAVRDQSSTLYKKIHESFVGPDPEEDYKDVIVWKVADNLYVTAAVDHNPSYNVKWDVVVYEEGQQL